MVWFPESVHCADCGEPIYDGKSERCDACSRSHARETMAERKSRIMEQVAQIDRDLATLDRMEKTYGVEFLQAAWQSVERK